MNLNQVTLACFNFEESLRFYQTLGFRLIVSSPPRYARFECGNGEAYSTLSLHRVETAAVTPSGVVIYFEFTSAAELDEKVRELGAKGIQFDSMPADQSWAWREARLRDPAGNALCFYHAGVNRRNPLWRVNSTSVS